jgi:hypothetical protein
MHGPDPEHDDAFTKLVDEFRRKLNHLPPENFADGVQAERTYRDDVCPNGSKNLFGPFVPPHANHGDTREVGGASRYLLFPDFFADWTDQQTPETLAAMTKLAKREVRKAIFNQILKENWVRASAAGGFVFACVQYGAQVFEWLGKNLPAIKSAWQLIRAGVAQ